MKLTIRLLAFLVAACSILAACNQKPARTVGRIVVTGKIRNFKDTAAVFTYDAFELLSTTQKPSVKINPDGSYKMVLESASPLKGFFSLGKVPWTYKFEIKLVNGKDSTLSVESFDFRMLYLWLEPGDSLTMNVDVEKINDSIYFNGRGRFNNEFVNEEEQVFNDYRNKYLWNYYNITYRDPDDYKNLIDQLKEEKLTFLKDYDRFHKLSPALLNVYTSDYITGAISSKISYPGGHSSFNQGKTTLLPPDYYTFLDSVNLSEHIGDKGIGYYYFLNAWLHKKHEIDNADKPEKGDFYQYVKSQVPARLAYEFMAYALARDFRKALYDELGANCPYPDIGEPVKKKYQHLEGMLEGNPAPAFSLADVNGKTVSLNDLRGKFVYIDFWATWCGPCIKEIPSLKKTEEEYRGKNIHFVSISYDKAADHDKWKNYVVENNLTGIQLIADEAMRSTYNKIFNIDLIPRFILLDPEGKIVSGNAPRPSSPKLKELLVKSGIK